MAQNPILYNDGGVHRFSDYVSQIPDFLKAEEDVVVLLQILSDYINNAYRNIDTVEKFQFSYVAVDSNLTLIQNRVRKFIELLKRSEARGEKILYLSKPQGNPRNTARPLFVEYIYYEGDLPSLTPSAANATLQDGDKVYVEFTKSGEEDNSGVFIYDGVTYQLLPDPNGTSQDPFNDTPNKPFQTAIGLAPRMLEFNVSDISDVHVKKSGVDGNLVYYNVFFNALVTNITDVTSVHTMKVDIDNDGELENILIDYYNMIETLPSIYDEDFEINFAASCTDFEWGLGYGSGLFYARALTQYERSTTTTNRDGKNKYVDPLYSPNTSVLTITDIRNTTSNRVQVTVNGEHKLSAGDTVTIKGAGAFDSQSNLVLSVVGTKKFIIQNSTVGIESGGSVISRNLFYSKFIDDPNKYKLKIPYTGFMGSDEFENNDKIARVIYEFPEVYSSFNAATEVDVASNAIIPSSPTSIVKGDTVFIHSESGGTLPTGLIEGIVYTVSEVALVQFNGYTRTAIYLEDQVITATGTGTAHLHITHRHFSTDSVDLVNHTFKVNDATNLAVGMAIRFRGATTSIILPAPLSEEENYVIEDILEDSTDGTNTLIKLVGVEFTDIGTPSVNFDVFSITPDLNSVGSVEITQVTSPLSIGTITLSTNRGDLISTGEIMRIASVGGARGLATAVINSTATVWKQTTNRIYYKGDYVVYDNMRYRVLKTHAIPGTETFNPTNNPNYILDMSDIIKRLQLVEINPYMFGMFDVRSLAFDGEVDYSQGFSELANDLYIKKEQELGLKYGYEQREFIFNPRTAPPEKLTRNGFMEIVNSDEPDDAYDGDVSYSIKANTIDSKLLYGYNDVVLNINYMSFSNGVVTVTTDRNHLFKDGITVEIAGVDQSEYNGHFVITVTDTNKFTYEISGTPLTPTGTTRTVTYTNDIVLPITSIVRSSNIATVTTGYDHGYNDITEVTIAGADQAGYNGTFTVTPVTANTFTYTVSGTEVTPATTSTEMTSTYVPQLNDLINVVEQYHPSENGTYVVSDTTWTEYDNTVIGDPVILFTRQNLFDISDANPSLADEISHKSIKSMRYIGAQIVEVVLYDAHAYTANSTIVNISGALQSDYNGRFYVTDIVNPTTFRYKIKTGVTPASPATGKLICYADQWYKFTLADIEWQKKSSYNRNFIGVTINNISGNGSKVTVSTYREHGYSVGDRITITDTHESGDPLDFDGTFIIDSVINPSKFTYLGGPVGDKTIGRVYKGYNIASNNNRDNVTLLRGEYPFTLNSGLTINFEIGDIVELNDQYLSFENGTYRVTSSAWTRLSDKLVMKVRDITVDAYEDPNYTGLYDDETPYVYRRYTDSQVNDFIDENFTGTTQVYKVESLFASNFQFIFEKVTNIDTAGPFQKQYDAKFDYNSIASREGMKKSFTGVTDMKYPLVEKFERLAYIKDPNVIDYEMIEYLARYMGYDITAINGDIEESTVYTTEEEREMALRRAIQNLPQYYSLKSTKSGLEMLLLTFGIVGELVTMWTRQENPYGNPYDTDPYDDMIPDYELRGLQYAENTQGKMSNFVPTPHFKIKVEIEGNFDNQLLPSDERRIVSQIERFKPINTVFDGIFRFLSTKLTATVTMGQVRTLGKMKTAVGFTDLIFDDEYQNDCI